MSNLMKVRKKLLAELSRRRLYYQIMKKKMLSEVPVIEIFNV